MKPGALLRRRAGPFLLIDHMLAKDEIGNAKGPEVNHNDIVLIVAFVKGPNDEIWRNQGLLMTQQGGFGWCLLFEDRWEQL